MHARTVLGGRALVLAAPGAAIEWPRERFVALVPAYSADERLQAHALVGELVSRGCVELCCVGPDAERLHDELDELLRADGRGGVDVITRWAIDPREGVHDFLFVADAGEGDLVGLVARRPELVALIELLVGDA